MAGLNQTENADIWKCNCLCDIKNIVKSKQTIFAALLPDVDYSNWELHKLFDLEVRNIQFNLEV